MPAPIYITGPAGTGKTTKLLERTAVYARELLTHPYQQLLAMAYMHGARKRLESSIKEDEECSRIPRTVSTIDSFALTLLNRWRTALGITLPVCAAPAQCAKRFERHARLHLTFDEIAASAAKLLTNSTVARIVACSYPLIVIDEFQDCIGPKLNLVRALADGSQLILAADAFQLLDGGITGCPAVDWVEGLGDEGLREHHRLTEPRRFSTTSGVFLAANALREDSHPAGGTVPLYYGPALPAAWRIMERLLLGWYGSCWTGTTALISPSSGGIIDDVLRLLAEQTTKRGYTPIRWARQTASEEEQAKLRDVLGVTNDYLDDTEWQPTADPADPHAAEVIDRARRFAHLRGLDRIPNHLISSLAEQVIHASRAHSKKSARFVVTTVHGAKNREFDNVCVLWSYQIPPNPELQRRLLYNAVTRAKTNCIVFDTRKKDIVKNDPIVTLLGSPKPTFDNKSKAKKASRQAKISED
jgi:superfamily I DNA/RNA helicase